MGAQDTAGLKACSSASPLLGRGFGLGRNETREASVLGAPDDAHREPDAGPNEHTSISTQGGRGGGRAGWNPSTWPQLSQLGCVRENHKVGEKYFLFGTVQAKTLSRTLQTWPRVSAPHPARALRPSRQACLPRAVVPTVGLLGLQPDRREFALVYENSRGVLHGEGGVVGVLGQVLLRAHPEYYQGAWCGPGGKNNRTPNAQGPQDPGEPRSA